MPNPQIPTDDQWWKVPEIDLPILVEHPDEEVRSAARKELRFRAWRKEQPE